MPRTWSPATPTAPDIFVFDRQTGTTTRVSVASDGTEGNSSSFQSAISADGRFVTYDSVATNLVPGDTNDTFDIFVFDRQTDTTSASRWPATARRRTASAASPSISADGRFVAYISYATNLVPGDTNDGLDDVFVFDRQTNTTELVSVASDGTEPNGSSFGGEFNLGRRPLCSLQQRCHELGPRRYQRHLRHLRVRPTDQYHPTRVRSQ